MANKNKKIKETIYRDKIRNGRWRFISVGEGGLAGQWKMERVKDGYWSYWHPEKLVEEGLTGK
jgi:hypothetical protein